MMNCVLHCMATVPRRALFYFIETEWEKENFLKFKWPESNKELKDLSFFETCKIIHWIYKVRGTNSKNRPFALFLHDVGQHNSGFGMTSILTWLTWFQKVTKKLEATWKWGRFARHARQCICSLAGIFYGLGFKWQFHSFQLPSFLFQMSREIWLSPVGKHPLL